MTLTEGSNSTLAKGRKLRVEYRQRKHELSVSSLDEVAVTWGITNAGDVRWPRGVVFVQVFNRKKKAKKDDGELNEGSEGNELVGANGVQQAGLEVQELSKGETQDIVVQLPVPSYGKHRLYYALFKPDGKKLGPRVAVKICASHPEVPRAYIDRKPSNEKHVDEIMADAFDPSAPLLPPKITHLFLDGNNMLFVIAAIRSMTLKRAKRAAEDAIERIAIPFATASNVPNTVLVYDSTPTYREKDLSSGGHFKTCSASPAFKISDDAIVDWVSRVPLGCAMVVTSDRGLIERVQAFEAEVIKPGRWLRIAASVIAGHGVENLNEWADSWLKARS